MIAWESSHPIFYARKIYEHKIINHGDINMVIFSIQVLYNMFKNI